MNTEKINAQERIEARNSLNVLKRAMAEGKNFHGSKVPGLKNLNPELARDYSYKHGEHKKVVYANTGSFLLPLILALGTRINPDIPMGIRISEINGRIKISSDRDNLQFSNIGYMYILDSNNFQTGQFPNEVYSDTVVPVEAEVIVTPEVIRLMVENGDIECDIPLES